MIDHVGESMIPATQLGALREALAQRRPDPQVSIGHRGPPRSPARALRLQTAWFWCESDSGLEMEIPMTSCIKRAQHVSKRTSRRLPGGSLATAGVWALTDWGESIA